MKHITQRLCGFISYLDAQIADREGTYNNRTDKWRESELGESFADYTDTLYDFRSCLEDWKDRIEEETL
jgi:hypothetical protein